MTVEKGAQADELSVGQFGSPTHVTTSSAT
jgi:hypothetical protein